MQKFIVSMAICTLLAFSLSLVWSQVFVRVPTSGVLFGYVVQDGNGRYVCRDPSAFNDSAARELHSLRLIA